MVIELKMCRFEDASWGFRLIGGSDFEVPLTVVKVTEGSIADRAGMKVGDVIVRINETPTINLSHNDAHKVILHCGNNFFLGIHREDEEESEGEGNHQEDGSTVNLNQRQNSLSPYSGTSARDSQTSGEWENETSIKAASVNSNQEEVQQENPEEPTDEEKIAEVLSGEAEVLKDHNVIGVNFNRIFPKAGICQSSEVFRTLNDEAKKTRIEQERERKKWTTFLQRPDRPVPKSKQELEEEAKRAAPYKVQIVKQPKPRVAPDHPPTPPPIEEPKSEEEPKISTSGKEEEEIPLPTDTEVPNLEPMTTIQNDNNNKEENNGETTNLKTEVDVNNSEAEVEETVTTEIENSTENHENTPPEVEKTEEELLLEKQLADVQRQLMALSSLPSTIQATLDAVTKQLSELLPNFKLQKDVIDIRVNNIKEEEIDVQKDDGQFSTRENSVSHYSETQEQTVTVPDELQLSEVMEQIEYVEGSDIKIQNDDELTLSTRSSIEKSVEISENSHSLQKESLNFSEEEVQRRRVAEEDLQHKKQKQALKEELEQRLIRERTPKRPPRPFGPLTPQQRPLILPGGRRWRTPKDAFNEEFIAEILSSQAELITGTTLGASSTYESPLLGYDRRVNFLKYQKPERKIDLDKSEVYKVVHHLEKAPRRGIEVRPPKVLSEEDVRSRAVTCG